MYISRRMRIPLVAMISIIFLEYWAVSSGRLINFDGILYLRSAEAMLNNDFAGAYAIYRWPLYSILIATVSQLFHLSLTMSAYVINGLLQVILTLSFINLIKQLGGNRRCQWLALIILTVHPYLNDYRSYIIRDFGYWAFFLLSLNFLISSVNQNKLRYAVFGSIILLIAAAFRVEGLIFVLLLPMSFLFVNQFTFSKRLIFLAVSLLPLIILGVMVAYFTYSYADSDLQHIGRMDHVINLFYAIPTIRDNVSTIISEMKVSVLDYQAQHGASVIVIGGLLVLMLFETVKVTSPVLFLLSAYAAKRHFIPKSYAKMLCKFTLLINFLILLYFVGTFNFLTGRYVMPICLILLLWGPFTIDHFYQYYCVLQTNKFKFWYFPTTVAILLGMFIYNITHWHYDKIYIREAGQWSNRHLAKEAFLRSNSAEYLFYSQGVLKNWEQHFIDDFHQLMNKASSEQIIAVKLNKKQALKVLPTLQNWKLLATFQNKRGDRLIIMKKTT